MKNDWKILIYILLVWTILIHLSCKKQNKILDSPPVWIEEDTLSIANPDTALFKINIDNSITIDQYFDFIEKKVKHYDTLVPYSLTEHLLVRANHWLIDTFANTDYYIKIKQDTFIFDQKKQVVLKKGNTLLIPNENQAKDIIQKQSLTSIDVNIPEFKLRILEKDSVIYTFPIRVGKSWKRYMSTVDREVDMKTKTGVGTIVKINRNPRWENPVNGARYFKTKRDDGRTTLVPRIPFLAPELDGHRWGQLIHPTTNPETLGKAYSNGCIGTREADAWRIYFYAPIGTKMVVRYDLEIEENSEKIRLEDIYGYQN